MTPWYILGAIALTVAVLGWVDHRARTAGRDAAQGDVMQGNLDDIKKAMDARDHVRGNPDGLERLRKRYR